MTDELHKAIADYFDPGDFAELIGVSTLQIMEAFPDEVDDCLDELLEIAGLRTGQDDEDDYSEGEE